MVALREKMRNESYEGHEFRIFGAPNPYMALQQCKEEGYKAVFAPELVSRMNDDIEGKTWKKIIFCCETLSLRVTGRTKQGLAVVVYVHREHHLTDLNNLYQIIKNSQKIIDGNAVLPLDDFCRLLDLEDNKTVFVSDHSSFANLEFLVAMKDALNDPRIIPILGGQEKAGRYLERCLQIKSKIHNVYNTEIIGLSSNFPVADVPLACFQGVGSPCFEDLFRFEPGLSMKPGGLYTADIRLGHSFGAISQESRE